MWCVIRTACGAERRTLERIVRGTASRALAECFVPQFQTQIKVHGSWRFCARDMMPGYLFAISEAPRELQRCLLALDCAASLVIFGRTVAALPGELVAFYERWTRPGDRVIPMSFGELGPSGVVVMSGPLLGCEGLISKVDRRKSTALVEFGSDAGQAALRVGLGLRAARCVAE